MKKLYFFVLLACIPFLANAEGGCFVQVQTTNCLCYGDCNGTAMAFPNGTAPFLYNWLPGGQTTQNVTNLCAGSYTVIVVDANNCTSTATFIIIEPTQIQIMTSVTNESCNGCCNGNIVSTVQGGTPGYTYLWSPTSQTTPVAQALCSGTYTLCVTDNNGCTSCNNATVSFNTGIIEQAGDGELSVFPNPATDKVSIRQEFGQSSVAEIRLMNVLGETVYSEQKPATLILDISLDISNLSSGVYFVTVSTETGSTVQKITKE